jgi:hypothetical protein
MTANMDDISHLAAMAYPPGELTGSPESRKDLWRAFFLLKEWYFLIHPNRETDPYPLLEMIKNRGYAYLFTSSAEARNFAEQKEILNAEGQAVILEMEQGKSLGWLTDLLDQGIYGVVINAAGNSWEASISLLLDSYKKHTVKKPA